MQVKVNIPDIRSNYVKNLLLLYGISDIDNYLNPTSEAILSPLLLDNMEAAGQLIKDTIYSNYAYGLCIDCDCDGYTSASILYQYIKMLNPNKEIIYYIHDGKAHGLEDNIEFWVDKNIDVLLLPDSSSNDKIYHDELIPYGIKCLVIDHHQVDNDISDNTILINNQISNAYSNKDNTGAGLVYQFCKYLDSIFNVSYANQYIDLAALGINGDMGSLLNLENRYIVSTGFKNINNFFFQVLIDKQAYSMNNKVTPISTAFYIVPLINSIIRVGTHAEKDHLFQAFINGKQMIPSNKRGAKGALEMMAIECARECTNAKSHQNKFKEEMVAQLSQKIEDENLNKNQVLFVKLDDDMTFPSELNGLVCMNLVSKYKKPALLGRENYNGEIKGSIRGLNNSELSDFKGFLMESGLFEYVQGHANAAGYCIQANNYDAFIQYSNEALKDINFNENWYEAQFVRDASDLDIIDIIKDVVKYQDVWGTGVPEPLIYVRGIRVRPSDIQVMGKNQDTLKIVYGGMTYIKFHAKDMIEDLKQYNDEFILEVIGRGNLNDYCGRITPQLFIESYEVKNSNILEF